MSCPIELSTGISEIISEQAPSACPLKRPDSDKFRCDSIPELIEGINNSGYQLAIVHCPGLYPLNFRTRLIIWPSPFDPVCKEQCLLSGARRKLPPYAIVSSFNRPLNRPPLYLKLR